MREMRCRWVVGDPGGTLWSPHIHSARSRQYRDDNKKRERGSDSCPKQRECAPECGHLKRSHSLFLHSAAHKSIHLAILLLLFLSLFTQKS